MFDFGYLLLRQHPEARVTSHTVFALSVSSDQLLRRAEALETIDFIDWKWDLERVKGIEPSSQAWEARILPLNHTRISNRRTCNKIRLTVQLLFFR
jgi:hypothetical protein